MNNLWIPRITFLWLACLPTTSLLAQSEPAQQPPNILFVFADDLAFDCVQSSGNHEIRTPNLDAMAKQGVTFTHA